MSSRILVTGAAGLLGGVLVKALVDRGFEVVATGRKGISGGNEILACDLCDGEAVRSLLAHVKPEAIVHAAGRVSRVGLEVGSFVRDNILATANLLDGARSLLVGRFIHISTISVYSGEGPFTESAETAATDPYGWSKRKAEELCLSSSASLLGQTILRLGGLHGYPRTSGVVYQFLTRAMKKEPILVVEPETQVSLTFLDDVASVVAKVLIAPQPARPSIFNVSTSETVSLRELAEIVSGQVGTHVRIIEDAPSRQRNRVLDNTRLRKGLGFEPPPLRQSLERVWRSLANSA